MVQSGRWFEGMGAAGPRAGRDGRHPPTVLFFSNGHGEDAVAAAIAARLRALAPHVRILAAPVVGEGLAFRRQGFEVVTPTRAMPSGGLLGARNPAAVLADLRAGLIRLHVRQALRLRALAPAVDLMVGVGDRVSLYVARWWLRLPLVLVAIADSVHLTGDLRRVWTPLDRHLMRRHTRRVFTRDQLSADLLRQDGVRARFVGNPMLDALETSPEPLPVAEGEGTPLVALLPGSRQPAYHNLLLLLEAVERMATRLRACYAVAWPAQLPLRPIREGLLAKAGWQWRGDMADGVASGGGPPAGLVGWLVHHPSGARVHLIAGRTGDVLRRAAVVVGLAGTANEQAAGLGKPVVTCPSWGPPVTRELVRRQKLLLGEAVRAVERRPQELAEAVVAILTDPALYRRMAREGPARMGPPGGARRIAEALLQEIEGGGAVDQIVDPPGS